MPLRTEHTLNDARDAILARPAAVLMLDTCGLLDVVRAPLRPKSGGLQPAIEVVNRVGRRPVEVHVVVTELVVREWERHYTNTCRELERHIDATRTHVSALREACQAFGISPPEEVSQRVELLKSGLPELAERLFDAAIVLGKDRACRHEASTHFNSGERPVRRGSSSSDDCFVLHHCLGLAAKLRESGFADSIVFTSSNTNDYCSKGSHLHPDLTSYFAPVRMEFASNLADARSKLWPLNLSK